MNKTRIKICDKMRDTKPLTTLNSDNFFIVFYKNKSATVNKLIELP